MGFPVLSVAGKKLSDDCKKELAAFKIELGTNINLNLPLANACKDDSTKYCSGEDPTDPGAVLACLRCAIPPPPNLWPSVGVLLLQPASWSWLAEALAVLDWHLQS